MTNLSDELINEFSWSVTRENIFSECKRKYFLQYYGSWRGWDFAAPDRIRELYLMKNLLSRPMWIGKTVHEITKWIINRLTHSSPVEVDVALAKVQRDMRSDWESSKYGDYKQWPKDRPGLFNHYYSTPISEKDIASDIGKATACIENLYNSPPYRYLASHPENAMVQVENLDSFLTSDIKVWVVLDLAVITSSDVRIIDWKTGGGDPDSESSLQLSVYGLYVQKKWNTSTDKVLVQMMNLHSSRCSEHQLSENDLVTTEKLISESASKMLSILSDIENNVAREENFPQDGAPNACRNCNFQADCFPL